MRKAILLLHRWAALTIGVFLLLISLSGAVLVYEVPIDHLLNLSFFDAHAPTPGSPMLSLDALRARAEKASPGVEQMALPQRAGLPMVAVDTAGTEIFVNPYTDALLGIRTSEQRNASFTRRVRALHVRLLAGSKGAAIVGVTTALALLVVLGGIVLWWQEKRWRVMWAAAWKRIALDLHHLLGIVAALILLIVTSTGVWMHYQAVGALVNRLDRAPHPQPKHQAEAAPDAVPISLDSAVAIGRTALPGATVRLISMPVRMTDPLQLSLAFPGDRTSVGRSRVTIDRYAGTVLDVHGTPGAQLGTRLTNLQRSLHTGEIFGAPTMLLWFLAALAMAAQVLTGFVMWWNGRPARKAAAARHSHSSRRGPGYLIQ